MENKNLRIFSKVVCLSTLFLIFAGGMVTSTGSGLAVPDWPLSYGSLFPPMIGGVFYEHGHRMIATLVGFLTLWQAIWIKIKEDRKWLRVLGGAALLMVILQGVLGGITVLTYLPTPISVMHAVLAQTFFIVTVVIAYSLSYEREQKQYLTKKANASFVKMSLIFVLMIYIQLILGAIMRHTGSGLAIPDFPKMGGSWIPTFNKDMLFFINDWRFENNLEPVNVMQVIFHFLHRIWAVLIVLKLIGLNVVGFKYFATSKKIIPLLHFINFAVFFQVMLGIGVVMSVKEPISTSLHVATGAAILGLSVLLFLRAAPLTLNNFKEAMSS